MQDPQSLHKYLYVHGDPVQGIDPSGEFLALAGGLLGLLGGIGLTTKLRGTYDRHSIRVGIALASFITGFFSVKLLNYGLWGRYESLWDHPSVPRPGFNDHISKQDWSKNIENQLNRRISQKALPAAQDANARLASKAFADKYVDVVQRHLAKHFALEINDAADFGAGGTKPGWFANAFGDEIKCWYWALTIESELRLILSDPSLAASGWKVRGHKNISQAGDASLGILFPHNFVSLTLVSNPGTQLDQDDPADFIFDPWANGRPDVFSASEFNQYWPLDAVNPFWGG